MVAERLNVDRETVGQIWTGEVWGGCVHDCEWCDSLSGGATVVAARQLKHLLFRATSFPETEKLAERNGLRPENCSYLLHGHRITSGDAARA